MGFKSTIPCVPAHHIGRAREAECVWLSIGPGTQQATCVVKVQMRYDDDVDILWLEANLSETIKELGRKLKISETLAARYGQTAD